MTSENQILWEPSKDWITKSNINQLIQKVNHNHSLNIQNYDELHQWSVNNLEKFWSLVLEETEIIYSGDVQQILQSQEPYRNRWFQGISLNYAENLIRKMEESNSKIFFSNEIGEEKILSADSLMIEVSKVQQGLRKIGIKKGDRVAAVLPNTHTTVIIMLAATALGAIWSSCSPEFGPQSILDRFSQILPTCLFVCDSYSYNGKHFYNTNTNQLLLKEIKSIRAQVIVPYMSGSVSLLENQILYDDLISEHNEKKIEYETMDFNDPLFILFSSGTTGLPKAIVHSVGGSLIQIKKEHRYHCDLKKGDTLFFLQLVDG